MSLEYFKERLLHEKVKTDKTEYYCKTCRSAILVNDDKTKYDINKFVLNSKKVTYIPPTLRRITKNMHDIGIIFTKNSMLYKAHENYLLNPKYDNEGNIIGHDCGIYQTRQ